MADYSQLNKTNKNIGEVLLEMISKSQSVLNHSQEVRKNLKPKIMEAYCRILPYHQANR